MLEQELVEIKLPGRDPVLPTLYYSIGHPLVPEGKRCIFFIHNTSPAAMRTVHAWEKKQQIPSATEKGDLDALGRFEVPEDMLIFACDSASTDASSDALQAWLTPACLVSQEARTQLQEAADAAMGPSESITLEAPVRDAEGNWSGGLAIERGDGRCKPVKKDTRCYTLANSYQSQKGIWSPAQTSKVNDSFDDNNLMRRNLNIQMPESTRKDIEDHTSMLNIPVLGLPGNTAHNTLQLNVAPEQPYGSEKTLVNSLGFYGGNHNNNKDSPARFTNMVMCSRLPDTYTLSKFHIPHLGIYFTLRNFDSANFCGLNYHGGTPPIAPQGVDVANDAYCMTFILYPPEQMGDGLGHVVVGAMPTAKDPVLKMSAEMQHVEYGPGYGAASDRPGHNFAHRVILLPVRADLQFILYLLPVPLAIADLVLHASSSSPALPTRISSANFASAHRSPNRAASLRTILQASQPHLLLPPVRSPHQKLLAPSHLLLQEIHLFRPPQRPGTRLRPFDYGSAVNKRTISRRTTLDVLCIRTFILLLRLACLPALHLCQPNPRHRPYHSALLPLPIDTAAVPSRLCFRNLMSRFFPAPPSASIPAFTISFPIAFDTPACLAGSCSSLRGIPRTSSGNSCFSVAAHSVRLSFFPSTPSAAHASRYVAAARRTRSSTRSICVFDLVFALTPLTKPVLELVEVGADEKMAANVV
ncbi:hypothetical protein B0H17DRAFT_1206482 [Mycena rosella]|uniref:Uncharacterized protein n=1 Tax=Mycena rosella TaxID=1033263 RepID=A0AAD7D514_MYCRO|nr:hypothetical protein B0H17DRAFT_1206482 [Mycena rosella]